MGLLITFVLGIFVLIGAAIAGFAKDEQRVSELSVAVALGAIVVLLLMDLLPETVEGIEHLGWFATLLAVAVGFVILLLLDRFLPESHEAHGDAYGHEHGSALHISIAVVIALTVGLLLYIVIMELIPSVARAHDKKRAAIGIIVGAAVVLVGVLLGGAGHVH